MNVAGFSEGKKRERLNFIEVWWEYLEECQPIELPYTKSTRNKSGLRLFSVQQCPEVPAV